MPMIDNDHVMVQGAMILWDGMTRPDTNESGTKHHFKLAVEPSNPDIALLEQLAQRKLSEGTFKGVLPASGTMPVATLGPSEYEGKLPGWKVFTCGTYRGVPDIYDENGQQLDIMAVSQQIYSGQRLKVMVHCYENNGKVKGIACGLDGFCVLTSQNAQRQNFGGGPGANTAAAFGGQPAQAAPAASAPPPPPQQAPAPAATVEMVNGGDYQAHIAQGWTDETLIAHGLARPAAAAGAPPPPPQQATNYLPGGQ